MDIAAIDSGNEARSWAWTSSATLRCCASSESAAISAEWNSSPRPNGTTPAEASRTGRPKHDPRRRAPRPADQRQNSHRRHQRQHRNRLRHDRRRARIRVKLALPKNASTERKQCLLAYGAELVLTDPTEGTDGAQRYVSKLVAGRSG